jgi:O-antigen/teichoic acid export membrane protein
MTGAANAPSSGAGSEDAHRKSRTRRALRTTLSALAGRGLGMLLSLISVPLTIGYLDKERYGLWITISSVIAWLGIADLGLGNGLSNIVTTSRAKGDHEAARRAISTTFMLLSGIALMLAVAFAASFSFVPWARVFAASARVDRRELEVTVALCLAVFALGFPLGVVDRVLGACQEGYIANYWSIGSAAISTAGLILAVRFGSGLPTLVLVLSIVPLAVRIASTLWVFTRLHPELRPKASAYRKDLARSLLATGASFLVVQLAVVAMWQNDNMVIAQLFGSEAVGPYSVAFRLPTLATGLVNMWVSPLWPAYADAAARGDYPWVRALLRRSTRLALAGATVAAIGMMILGPWVIQVWTRKAEMVPSRGLLAPMAVYTVLITFCQVNAMALNGLGRMRGQMIYGTTAAIVNVGLSILLGRAMGIAGVCWATCIAASLAAVIQPFELRAVLRELESGNASPPETAKEGAA